MKRVLVFVVVAVAAASIWLALRDRTDPLEAAITAIEGLEAPADRAAAAVRFVEENPGADPEILARGVRLATDSAGLDAGQGAAIQIADRLLALDLPPAPHYNALAGLTSALLGVGGAENIERARGIADEFTNGDDAPNDAHLSVAIRHLVSESLEGGPLRNLVFSGYARRTDETAETWHALIDAVYRRRLTTAREERGTAAALAVADSMVASAPDGAVAGIVHSMIYHITVDEMPELAVDAARELLNSTDLENSGTFNSVAYDMAERGLEADLAVALADRALRFVTSRYDSTNVLDTAGWARYAAGDYDGAAERLETAFALQDESPSFASVVTQHLLESYTAAGRDDSAIDLLTLVAARSAVDAGEAREMLSPLLRRRDGTDAAMNEMIAARRYEGVEAAPAFALPDRAGEVFSSEGHRGEILLVCFWSYG